MFEALALAVAAFDEAELWDLDGSTSMAAWLRIHTGMTQREGMRLSSTARRLRELVGMPVDVGFPASGCPLVTALGVERYDGPQTVRELCFTA